jgi:hypothetical protein
MVVIVTSIRIETEFIIILVGYEVSTFLGVAINILYMQ